ncbi:hypothetical protein C8R44DRAFT_741719 [Mycena epipterygia]|nr:hypothetical protein C8R44DRAFT_741719 [Mycena epipterygia]
MPSFTVIAPRWNPIQRWRVHGLGDEFWTDRASSGLDKVPGRSQVSAEQNEPRTSWKDEEVVENEAVSHKRCHAKNKQTRVRQPTPPAKPARHHVNSINQRRTLFLGAPLHVFQHANKLGQEICIHTHLEAKWPTRQSQIHPYVRERARKIHMKGGAANMNMFMVLSIEWERREYVLTIDSDQGLKGCLLYRLGGECREQFMLISSEAVRLIRAQVIVCGLLEHDSALNPSQRDSLLGPFIRHNIKVNTDSVADGPGLKEYQYQFGGEGSATAPHHHVDFWNLIRPKHSLGTNTSTLGDASPSSALPSDAAAFRGFPAGRLRGALLGVADSGLALCIREVHWNVMRPTPEPRRWSYKYWTGNVIVFTPPFATLVICRSCSSNGRLISAGVGAASQGPIQRIWTVSSGSQIPETYPIEASSENPTSLATLAGKCSKCEVVHSVNDRAAGPRSPQLMGSWVEMRTGDNVVVKGRELAECKSVARKLERQEGQRADERGRQKAHVIATSPHARGGGGFNRTSSFLPSSSRAGSYHYDSVVKVSWTTSIGEDFILRLHRIRAPVYFQAG